MHTVAASSRLLLRQSNCNTSNGGRIMTNKPSTANRNSSHVPRRAGGAFSGVSEMFARQAWVRSPLTLKSMFRGFAGLLALMLSTGALSEPIPKAQVEQLRQSIAALSQGKVAAEDVSRTPIPGIFQVVSDGEIFYVDATGRYSFVGGSMIDMQQQRDLTALELDRVHAIAFDRLPLQLAIKEVKGDGARSLAVFEDPNCPSCKVFTKFLDHIDNVTIYRFMYPVIAPQSEAIAQTAWCAADRSAAWRDAMQGSRGMPAPSPGVACDTSGLAAILRFGETNRIDRTPTVILGSGKRLVGATPPELFMQELESGGRRPN